MYMLLVFSMAMNFYGLYTGVDPRITKIHSSFQEEGLFLGRGMGGVVITLNSGHTGSDLRQHISHLDGSQGSVEALIPAFGTCALNSLLDVVSGEHAIDHWDASLQANRSNPF